MIAELKRSAFLILIGSYFFYMFNILNFSLLPNYLYILSKKKELEQKIDFLEEKVFSFKKEIALLYGNTAYSDSYLELIARREYGLINENESGLIFNFSNDKSEVRSAY